MDHRSSAGPTLRPFGYPFVELHITSLCFLQMNLCPPGANVQVGHGVCSGVRFCGWWDLQGLQDVAITWGCALSNRLAGLWSLSIVVRTHVVSLSALDVRGRVSLRNPTL